MGNKSTTITNSTQESKPPEWTAPGLSAIGNRVSEIIPTMPGAKYGGDFIAQPGAGAWQIPGMYDAAAQRAQQLVHPAMETLNRAGNPISFGGPATAAPQGFGNYDASGIQGVIDAAIQPALRQLTQQVLPGIRSSGTDSGAYGGSRAMQVLPGMAMNDFSRNAQEIGTQIAFQDHQAHQDRLLNAFGLNTQRGLGAGELENQRMGMTPALMDSIMRMQTGSADIAAQGAGYDQMLRQMGIDNELAKFDYNIRYPYQGLDVAAALLGQVGNPWGTQTTNGTQTQKTGGLAPIVGGLMGAGMMAAGMPGGFGGVSSLFGGASSAMPAFMPGGQFGRAPMHLFGG